MRFRWRRGSKVHPYGLWRLGDAEAAGYVVLVEGESDCHTLWHYGIPALGIPGANTWRDEWARQYLDQIPVVYAVVEPDTGGHSFRDSLGCSPVGDRLQLIDLGEHKDPSGLHLHDPEPAPASRHNDQPSP